jgi:hypothetical protein
MQLTTIIFFLGRSNLIKRLTKQNIVVISLLVIMLNYSGLFCKTKEKTDYRIETMSALIST